MSDAYPERTQPWSEYSLVGRIDAQELVNAVESLIRMGWQPQGGPFISGSALVQAMVR